MDLDCSPIPTIPPRKVEVNNSLLINPEASTACKPVTTMTETLTKKLHIAVFPWLAVGHLFPFFELSKLIALKGHQISFISTPRNLRRLSEVPSNLQSLINMVEIPLPHEENLPENAEATMDIPSQFVPYLKRAFDGLQEPLGKFLERSKPDWIIYDFAPYWLPAISTKLGISGIWFNIYSVYGSSYFISTLVFKEKSSEVHLRPFEEKTMSGDHVEQNESGVSDIFRNQQIVLGADAVASRSCREIEGESLSFLEKLIKKPVIPIGLLPPSLNFYEDEEDENWDKIVGWLDKQEKNSVVYIAFGSEVTLSKEEFTEIAMGLDLSGLSYFWTLKNQSSPSGSSEPAGLPELSKQGSNVRGVVWTTWAPQLRILGHKSIGGFLTHCGWSSVIESLQFGCPLIMLPFQNEQGLVARLLEDKKVGIRVPRNDQDGKFTRDSVAKSLRSVILEEEGKVYRNEAEKMSKIFGDTELHQKYIDKFVEYMETQRL